MSDKQIKIQPLTSQAFAPFGQVIEINQSKPLSINQGLCQRFHDLIAIDVASDGGSPGLSLFHSKISALPYSLEMVERHPLGSQAFLPMSHDPFLVVVAPDAEQGPGQPLAFLSEPGQGVNYYPNTWHGVLTPLSGTGLFAVIDRIGGEGSNLEEIWFHKPYQIVL